MMMYWGASQGKSLLNGDCEVAALDILPINDLPYLVYVVRTDIFVVDVVSVLPNINCSIKRGVLRRGVSPAGAIISWLVNSMSLRLFAELSYPSHPQPDPWIGTVRLVISSMSLSKDPNCLVTAWEKGESYGGYSPPPLPMGARLSQYIEWLMCPPRLNLMVLQSEAILFQLKFSLASALGCSYHRTARVQRWDYWHRSDDAFCGGFLVAWSWWRAQERSNCTWVRADWQVWGFQKSERLFFAPVLMTTFILVIPDIRTETTQSTDILLIDLTE